MLNPETFQHVKIGNTLFFNSDYSSFVPSFCRQIQNSEIHRGGIDASSPGFDEIAKQYGLESFMYGCTKLYRMPKEKLLT